MVSLKMKGFNCMTKRILFFIFLLFTLTLNTRPNKLSGEWLLTNAEIKGKVEMAYPTKHLTKVELK